jgi:hypothetical protein
MKSNDFRSRLCSHGRGRMCYHQSVVATIAVATIIQLLAVINTCSLSSVYGWVNVNVGVGINHRHRRHDVYQKQYRHHPLVVLPSTKTSTNAVDDDDINLNNGGITTIGLRPQTDEEHEQIGQELADSIIRWLDSEWFPQEIHVQMGLSAKRSYIECRSANENDVMDIMMKISLDLSDDWHERFDADAFINPYDVGNYAADWLTKKLTDIEGCECTSELF